MLINHMFPKQEDHQLEYKHDMDAISKFLKYLSSKLPLSQRFHLEQAASTLFDLSYDLHSKDYMQLGLKSLATYNNSVYVHSVNVAILSALLASKLEVKDIENVAIGALFHDFGKVLIPEDISSPEHMEIFKQHPKLGYDMFNGRNLHPIVTTIIIQHHEFLDGSGFPEGLKGDRIHLYSQIVSVANILDSIITFGSTEPALSIEEALKVISTESNVKLSPIVIDAANSLFTA